jgi:hypothetical protein
MADHRESPKLFLCGSLSTTALGFTKAFCRVWLGMPVIPIFQRLRLGDGILEDSLGYTARSYPERKKIGCFEEEDFYCIFNFCIILR